MSPARSQFDTYAEISPSGTGFKLYGLVSALPDLGGDRLGCEISVDAPVPDGAEGSGHKTPEIGLYGGRRFFAVTGQVVEGKPLELRNVADAVHALAAEISGQSKRKANETRQGGATAHEPGEAPPPPPEDLPPWLVSLLAADQELDATFRRGTKLGRGKDQSRSGLEVSLAIRLRQLGRTDAEIAEALRLFPHGTVRTLPRVAAERGIERILAATAVLREGGSPDFSHDELALDTTSLPWRWVSNGATMHVSSRSGASGWGGTGSAGFPTRSCST